MNLNNNNINVKNFIEDRFEKEKYYLIKGHNVYKITIYKIKNEIKIKSKNYEVNLNYHGLSMLTNILMNSINDAYQFIINLFEQNNIIIKEILINKSLTLSFKINFFSGEKNIDINLLYSNKNNNLINANNNNDNYNELKNHIQNLENEIETLKKDIKILKNYHKSNLVPNKKKDNFSEPKNIQFLKNIVNDSYSFNDWEDNSFTVFKSINDLIYLIYAGISKSLVFYDLTNDIKIKEIKNAHNSLISNIKYYLDNINKNEYIMSISSKDKNIKIWDIDNYECISNIDNINKKGNLKGSFLSDNNKIFIAMCSSSEEDFIRIYDLKGQKIKEIYNSNDITYFIESYYDNDLLKSYIITGNDGYVKSYDYKENKVYHKYCDNDKNHHCSIITVKINNEIKLIESSWDGNVRIWNFHSGALLNKIKVSDKFLNGICLWNTDYLFVGCSVRHLIKLVDLNYKKVINEFSGHNNNVITTKKIVHPKYGECLISKGAREDNLKLWINKSLNN